jgi:hypothetical protein
MKIRYDFINGETKEIDTLPPQQKDLVRRVFFNTKKLLN